MIDSIFIGTRLEALEILKLYTNVRLIITNKSSRVLQEYRNSDANIQIISATNKTKMFDLLSKRKSNLVLSAGFPYICPSYVLKNGSLFLNSHPALLPSYKGKNPIKDALKCKERYMGVTLHHMIEEVDAGPIIVQEKVLVSGLSIQDIYQLLFGVVEPFVVAKGLDFIINKHF